MLARIPAAALAVLSVSILAVANPAPGNNPPPAKTTTVTVTATAPHPTITSPSGTCTTGTGPTQCCKTITPVHRRTPTTARSSWACSGSSFRASTSSSALTAPRLPSSASGTAIAPGLLCGCAVFQGNLVSIGCIPIVL